LALPTAPALPALTIAPTAPILTAPPGSAIVSGPERPIVPRLPQNHERLVVPVAPVDTCNMSHPDLELFDAHPEWRPLLVAYHDRQVTQKIEWSGRVEALDGATSGQIATLHGKLIALGLLKFEIASRADGVQYQVTPLGRQALLAPESRQLAPDWMQSAEGDASAA
jgi:hypothetical protein